MKKLSSFFSCLTAIYFQLCVLIISLGSSESSKFARVENNDVLKMRIIAEPLSLSNFAQNLNNNNEDDDEELPNLFPFLDPSNFSGPEHFRPLIGQCFTLQNGNFEYKICPFQNATQKQTSYAMGRSKYHGIIGIWHDWIVENGKFAGWRFLNGDECGKKGRRTTTINFACGNNNLVWEATEPEQCRYKITFKLPQACFPDSLLVYPTLSDEMKLAWDTLEGEKLNGELTQKGYERILRELFIKAGIMRKEDESNTSPVLENAGVLDNADVSTSGETGNGSVTFQTNKSDNQFANLQQCQQAYEETVTHLHDVEKKCLPVSSSNAPVL